MAAADTFLESGYVDPPCYDPEQLTGDLIKWAALCTHDSGVNAYAWCRSCSSFGSASVALCNSLAAVAHCLCVQDVVGTPENTEYGITEQRNNGISQFRFCVFHYSKPFFPDFHCVSACKHYIRALKCW